MDISALQSAAISLLGKLQSYQHKASVVRFQPTKAAWLAHTLAAFAALHAEQEIETLGLSPVGTKTVSGGADMSFALSLSDMLLRARGYDRENWSKIAAGVWRLPEVVETMPDLQDLIAELESIIADIPSENDGENDGPIAPDCFVFGGISVSGLPSDQWRLLEILWGRGKPKTSVPITEVIERIYRGRGRSPADPDEAIRKLRGRTQESLYKHYCPLVIDCTNDSYRLLPVTRKK